jgi:MFS transporter, ACS family, D-galactonate transporter
MLRRSSQWVIIGLLFFAAAINYIDRGSLSVAAPALSAELKLSPVKTGWLLSAFFWTYAGFQIVSGYLTDRFPVSIVFGAGYFLWSLATLSCGFAQNMTTLVIFRLLLGVGESVAFPSFSKVIAAGFPMERRGLPNALLEAGTKLGPAIGTLAGGFVIAAYGWRALFWILGAGSLVWLIPWLIWAPRPLETSPTARHDSPGMIELLRRKDVWGTCIGNACYTYSYYFLLTWLPTYLVKERHASLQMMGVLGSLPYFGAAAAAVVSGWVSDRWIASGASPTRVRKTFVAAGLLLSTVMVGAVLVPDMTTAVILLIAGYIAFGIFASNHWAITQTLAGQSAAGKWTGIQNTIGNLSGVAAPVVTGLIIDRTGSYYWAFLSPAALALIGAWAYIFMVGPVSPIDWKHRAR